MMNLIEGQIDQSLRLRGDATVTARAKEFEDGQVGDEVRLSWTVESGTPKCIWVQVKVPGGEYPSRHLHRDKETERHTRPAGTGQLYRLFAVSDAGRSEPVEACVEVTTPQRDGIFDGPPQAPDAGQGQSDDSTMGRGVVLGGLGACVAGAVVLLWPRLRRTRLS
jgi:hypothetical protein